MNMWSLESKAGRKARTARIVNALSLAVGMPALLLAKELKVGEAFPDHPSVGLERTLPELKGKFVLVDFWASGCGPCPKSFPLMNQLQSPRGGKGLAVLAINLDEEASDAQSFLASHPADFKVACGANQDCAAAFQVEAMPSSYLIDREGRARYIHHRFRAGDAELLQGLATSLVAEPAAAP